MKLKSLACALAVLSGTASAAVLSNGNFETGSSGVNTTSWTSNNWSHSGNVYLIAPFPGAGSGGGFWYGAGSLAQDGNYALAFNAGNTTPNSTLWQTFATVSGQTYNVEFDFGATGGSSQFLNVGVLGANGNTSLATYQASDSNNSAPFKPLSHFSFSFVADGSSATLSFADAGNATFDQDGVLDNVAVSQSQAVPEPLSGALFGLGLTVLLWARRRA